VWGELQNIATDFINKHGNFVKEIIFDDRLGIPKEAEAEVANLHRSTITADPDPSAKSWIQRALTKNLANLKKALPSTKFSISANQPAIALENQNQSLGEWIKRGIINGDYNLQLYKNGDEYQSFVNDYNRFIPRMLDLLNQNKSRLSISLISRANKKDLKRKDLIAQATFLRHKGLRPSQIIGFDYQKIKNIPA
jgi:hypothetical protein